MKYVRTKDGIYEIAEEIVNEYTNKFVYKTAKGYFYNESKIIKQADTIEELCDEFIWVDKNGEHNIKPKTSDGLWLLCCGYKNGEYIYGAIWTNKGLIYVTKLNKSGELELI